MSFAKNPLKRQPSYYNFVHVTFTFQVLPKYYFTLSVSLHSFIVGVANSIVSTHIRHNT